MADEADYACPTCGDMGEERMTYRLTWTALGKAHCRIFTDRWSACDFKWRQERLFGIISKFEEIGK